MHGTERFMMLWIFLGFVAVAMVAGVVAIVLPGRFVDDRVLASIFIVGAYSLGGMVIASLGSSMRRTRRVAALSMAASMIGYLAAVWFEAALARYWEHLLYKFTFICLIIGLVLMHRLLVFPLRSGLETGKIARSMALFSGAALGAVCIAGIAYQGLFRWDGWYIRTLGIAGIVVGGSSIIAASAALFGPKPGEDEPGLLGSGIGIGLTCPRCEHAICARSNRESRCENCRLKIRVEIEEPRCACGYLLYQLQNDLCPECGRTVEEGERWSGPSIQNA